MASEEKFEWVYRAGCVVCSLLFPKALMRPETDGHEEEKTDRQRDRHTHIHAHTQSLDYYFVSQIQA